MNIVVNGQPRATAGANHLDELVTELGLVPETLLIEHNGTALRREEWAGRRLSEGDRLELIRIVAGG